MQTIWLGRAGSSGKIHEIENCRAYRDRLVLKLRDIDDASAAASLRGFEARACEGQAPSLGEDEYYDEDLVERDLFDESGERLGQVLAVWKTAGPDLLVVETPDGQELLVPLVREIVLDVAPDRIRVRLPVGLAELNRESEA